MCSVYGARAILISSQEEVENGGRLRRQKAADTTKASLSLGGKKGQDVVVAGVDGRNMI